MGAPARARGADRARRLRRPLPRLAADQRRLLAGQGADDRRAAGDAGRDPPAARRASRPSAVAVPPRMAGTQRDRAARCDSAGRRWRSSSSAGPPTRASWPCATRRSGRPGTAPSCAPSCRSCAASRSSTPARTATPPTSCSAPTPTCRWSSSPTTTSTQNPEKPFDTGDAYSPIDFDSFSRGTLDRFPYVITGRAAWNSEAPPNFRRIAATPSYRALEADRRRRREDRHVLLEGTEAGGAGRAAPRRRSASSSPTRAAPRSSPTPSIGPKLDWDEGSVLGSRRADLADARAAAPGAGGSRSSTSPPSTLTLSAPGLPRAS